MLVFVYCTYYKFYYNDYKYILKVHVDYVICIMKNIDTKIIKTSFENISFLQKFKI